MPRADLGDGDTVAQIFGLGDVAVARSVLGHIDVAEVGEATASPPFVGSGTAVASLLVAVAGGCGCGWCSGRGRGPGFGGGGGGGVKMN
ncbi:UNVERIFIED_CONTAM: hypothetical protein Slati_3491400 [Sesamum latifolium]|uniref:Uncharacterized protein n=1 Tax=Sesamum latifolium TaxID=2727402 RepID=A0AAW2UK56_9LAMI